MSPVLMAVVRILAQAGAITQDRTRLDTHTPSYMRPAGIPGASEATLGWWLTGIAIAVVVIITALLLVGIARQHPADDDQVVAEARTDRGGSTASARRRAHIVPGVRWIYVGVAITVAILIGSYGGTLVTMAHAARPPQRPPITLDVVAHQWWWEIRVEDTVPSDAFTTANEVHVPVGVPVRLRLRSYDVIHSFWVPELGGKMDVIPGQVNEAWWEAKAPGMYRGQCAEYCGLQHARMALAVTADAPAQYAAWAAAQRQSAQVVHFASDSTGVVATGAHGVSGPNAVQPLSSAPPTTATGEAVFVSSCGGCHTVRGTDALGHVGPDLTHVASRMTIGAGMLDNTPENMLTWVRNAQAVKPGVIMPHMDLRENDLRAVVAYLQTLR